ncbi:MAG: GerMN domain-containing protein [Trueperaceae bacterium]|nr:GerMN domain-containing protein [Trueperaceae bacterium]
MDRAALRAVALRVAALALLLLLVLVAVIIARTLNRVPDATIHLIRFEEDTFTLVPVHRRLGTREPAAFAHAAVAALAEGPTASEAEDGLASAVPEDTRVLSAELRDGSLTVDLSAEFEDGGGTASMRGRLEQVRWTLSGPSSVTSVRLSLDGAPLKVLGGEGLLVETSWSRPPSGALPRW